MIDFILTFSLIAALALLPWIVFSLFIRRLSGEATITVKLSDRMSDEIKREDMRASHELRMKRGE